MLLAQTSSVVQSSGNFEMPVFAVLVGLVLIAVTVLVLHLAFGYARRSRELTHAERIKAVENGQLLDESDSPRAKFMHNAFWIAFWLVALVPPAAFSAASSALSGAERSIAFAVVVWTGASAAALGAVAGATVLMLAARGDRSELRFDWKKSKVEKDLYV